MDMLWSYYGTHYYMKDRLLRTCVPFPFSDLFNVLLLRLGFLNGALFQLWPPEIYSVRHNGIMQLGSRKLGQVH
jgi:hypothetical protein